MLKRNIGRTNLYKLNRGSPVAKQIKILNTVSNLVSRIPRVNGDVYLFCSAARGEDDEKSDIDVLIIGSDSSVINTLGKINRRIKVTFFTSLKWSKMAREDSAFYERVEKDKIKLSPGR